MPHKLSATASAHPLVVWPSGPFWGEGEVLPHTERHGVLCGGIWHAGVLVSLGAVPPHIVGLV